MVRRVITARERLDAWFAEADKLLTDMTVSSSAMRFNPDAEAEPEPEIGWYWPFPY